jgi:hypothetical protein
MIGTEAFGKRLTAPSLVEHAADADAVDMRSSWMSLRVGSSDSVSNPHQLNVAKQCCAAVSWRTKLNLPGRS